MRRLYIAGRLAAALCVAVAACPAWADDASPHDFDARFLEARALALDGHREAAIAAYTELLSSSPANADVLLGRGRVYAWMGNWTAAETDLAAAVTASPRYADAWSALGDLYLWSDRPDKAVEAYGRWTELAPRDPAAWMARGRAQRSAGHREAARADFETATGLGADPMLSKDLLVSVQDVPLASVGVRPPDAVPAGGYRWSASTGVDFTDFPSAGMHWVDTATTIRRRFDTGSLGLEALTATRFGTTDSALALDGYRDLWARAYVNLRFQEGLDATLFPRTRWRGELFQGVGHGWELSASYDRLQFYSAVEIYGIGVGRYVGNWYLRWRHLYVPGTAGDPSWSHSDRLTVRNYYAGDADNYLEASAGIGRTDEPTGFTLGPGSATHSWSASAAIVRFVTAHVGFKLGLDGGYGVEGEPYNSFGFFGTLYYRW